MKCVNCGSSAVLSVFHEAGPDVQKVELLCSECSTTWWHAKVSAPPTFGPHQESEFNAGWWAGAVTVGAIAIIGLIVASW